MQQQLARVMADFESAQARLDRLALAVPDEHWTERTDPERWSVAECVAHLNLTSRAYLPLIRNALAGRSALRHEGPALRYRRDPVGWLISVISGPLPGWGRFRFGRTRTAPAFVPGGSLSRARLLEEFDRLQAEQMTMVKAAEGLPIDRMRIVSPFDARVRYNLYAALVMLPRHQHRHLWQAEQVWVPRPVPMRRSEE